MEKIMLDIVYMISLGYKNENKFRNTAQNLTQFNSTVRI